MYSFVPDHSIQSHKSTNHHNMSRNQVHERRTTTAPPSTTPQVSFDTILPPTDDEVINHLKRTIIFGRLDQKRNFIVNCVIPLRPDILRMMRALTPFLVDIFVSVLPASAKEIPKNGKAEDMARRWLKLTQVLQSFKGAIDGGAKRLTRGESDFLNAGPFNKAVEDLDGAV